MYHVHYTITNALNFMPGHDQCETCRLLLPILTYAIQSVPLLQVNSDVCIRCRVLNFTRILDVLSMIIRFRFGNEGCSA